MTTTTDPTPDAITIADLADELEVPPGKLALRITALIRELDDHDRVIHTTRSPLTTLIHREAADILREQATRAER